MPSFKFMICFASHRWSVYLWINAFFTCLIELKIRCIQIKPNNSVKWSFKVQFISCFCFRCETPPYRDKEKSEKSSWFLLLCQFYEVAGILYCSLLLKSFFFSLHVIWTLRVNKLLFFIHSLTSFAASVCSIWLGWRNVREPFVFFLKKEQWILHGEYYCKNAVIN